MSDSGNRDNLPEQLTDTIRAALVRACRDTYDTNGTYYYDPDAGHNAMTLGQQLNAGICKNLADNLVDMPGVEVQIKRNTVDVVVDDLITIRPAKLGRSKDEDVQISLPNSRNTARRKALNNVYFTPAFDAPDFSGPRDFFLGHFGDQEGCQAIYLCAPAVMGREARLGWRLCVLLYIDDSGESDSSTSMGPVPPEPDLDDNFDLGIKDPGKDEDIEG